MLLLSAGFAGLALDKMTGELVWESSPTERIDQLAMVGGYGYYATPVLCNFEGKRCGLFYEQTKLSAVDLASGKVMWACPSPPLHPISEPIVSGKSVFLSQWCETRLLEMAPNKPATIWSNTNRPSSTNGPFLVEVLV
ncbi:MAG: hypothetical protein NTU88_02460 [Armatimonadetes bacterium]|nr:hypothetical protein [Armatimonadota bacterium]